MAKNSFVVEVTFNGGKKMFYDKSYARIWVNTDNDLPLNKPLKFPTVTIIIRMHFQKGEELYPQIYLMSVCMSSRIELSADGA